MNYDNALKNLNNSLTQRFWEALTRNEIHGLGYDEITVKLDLETRVEEKIASLTARFEYNGLLIGEVHKSHYNVAGSAVGYVMEQINGRGLSRKLTTLIQEVGGKDWFDENKTVLNEEPEIIPPQEHKEIEMNQLTNYKIKSALNAFGFDVQEVSHHVEERDGRLMPIFIIDGDYYDNVSGYGYETAEEVEEYTDSTRSGIVYNVFNVFTVRNSRMTFTHNGPQQGPQTDLIGKLFNAQQVRLIDTINLDFITLRDGKYRIVFKTNIGDFKFYRKDFDTVDDAIDFVDTPMKHRSFVAAFKKWMLWEVNNIIFKSTWGVKEEQNETLTPEQHEDLSKSIAQAVENEPVLQVECEQMRKLRAITEAAQTLIVEIDSPIKSEKAQMAVEVIDSLEKAVNFKPTSRLDAASRNTLRMKFFKGLDDYEVYDNNIRFTFDTETRVISGWIGESKYDIVKLDTGVSPDKWAMDGRRNWRPLKKFIDWVKTGAWEVEIYKQEDEQAMADFHQEAQLDAEKAEEKARQEHNKKMWEKDLEELKRVWAEFTGNWKAFEEKMQWVPADDKGRLYEILGIKEGDNVKSAYRSWMKKMHPDLNPNSDLALVQEVNALMDKIAKR